MLPFSFSFLCLFVSFIRYRGLGYSHICNNSNSSSTSNNSSNNTLTNMKCSNSLPKPQRAHRGQSTQAGEMMLEQHKNHTHSNPFRNDFQWYSRGYESGNHALIDNADRLGKPTTEFTLISYDTDSLGTYKKFDF